MIEAGWARILGSAVLVGTMFMNAPAAFAPAGGETAAPVHLTPPANGVMGFVVQSLTYPVVHEPDACPDGPQLPMRQDFLERQAPEERARLLLKENDFQQNPISPIAANRHDSEFVIRGPRVRIL